MREGGCNCGALRYRVTGPLRPVIGCHCTQCRKATGHFVAATSALRSDIEVIGEVQWYQSSEMARRGFCGICGSNVFWDGPGQNLSIMAGTLDGETGLQMAGHIFCADKGDYYEISDDLHKAAGSDASLTTMAD